MILPDLLREGLNVVFCGTAPGEQSASKRAYYAGTGNLFYPTLFSCGFTPRLYRPEEYPMLLDLGIGLTDMAKFTCGVDRMLKEADFDVPAFKEKILRHQPGGVCFTSKEAARVYFGLKGTGLIDYGPQKERIGQTRLYVAPSTSRQAFKYFDIRYWKALKSLLQ